MRIAFDYQIFSWQTYGGISRYFTRLADQFILRGQEIAIFAPLYLNQYVDVLPRNIVRGRKSRFYPPGGARMLLLLNAMFSRRAMKTWHPDVIHETYYSPLGGSTSKSCKAVITVFDMIHELFGERYSARNKTTKWKRAAVDRADHVICISECTRRDLVNLFGINEKKTSVVYLGFDQFADGVIPTEDKGGAGRPYLLYVGDRGPYKNFSGFIRAISSSRRLKADFDIVAFGGGNFNPSETLVLRQLGFRPEQVRQMGGNDKVLCTSYDHAAALVFPSLYEGFGLPPLEAMARQCPVISSKTSSMPEVIGDAGEFFDPNSIDDMVRAIESVVYSPDRTEELILRGRKRLDLFSWDRCAERTLEIYHSLLDH